MADVTSARVHRAIHHRAVDIDTVLRSAQLRTADRPIRVSGAALSVQQHADALGRGEPTVSPARVRVDRG